MFLNQIHPNNLQEMKNAQNFLVIRTITLIRVQHFSITIRWFRFGGVEGPKMVRGIGRAGGEIHIEIHFVFRATEDFTALKNFKTISREPQPTLEGTKHCLVANLAVL